MPATLAARLGPPPTTELGAPGVLSWAGWLDTWEETAELVFPLSLKVYDRMRRSDSQVDAVQRAADLPILGTRWHLDPEGCDPRVVAAAAAELGLDLDRGTAARRRRRGEGVVFLDVIRHALLCRPFGFMPLEQVYAAGPPHPGQEGAGLPPVMYHLRKLAPRMPRSITGIDVAPDGGLIGIRQYVTRSAGAGTVGRRPAGITQEVLIPADRLVMFVNDREGGDWTGRSILRSSYGHWLIKTALMKLGPMVAERNGMGVPVVYYSADSSRAEALEFAKGFRAGDEAGAALPDGKMRAELLAVTGTLRDELPLLKYHDEAIGRSALAMFLNLGHDNGARSLGETFVDYFLAAETATIRLLEDTLTEYVVRDWVEANFGPDEPYPQVKADELAADSAPTAEAIGALVTAGILTADADLEAALRRRYRLPARAADAPPPPGPQADGPGDPAAPAPAPGPEAQPVASLPPGSAAPPGMTADELLKLVNAAAALIRSGFAPDRSLTAVGLNPIDHLGLLPVTVQKPEDPVAGLADRSPTAAEVARAVLAASAPTVPAGSIAERAAEVAQRAAELAAAHAGR